MTQRQIFIKHWKKRMQQVYGLKDLEDSDFESQKKEYQFMLDAMSEYKLQADNELLNEIDNKLRELEDIAHGEVGENITEIRGMIQKAHGNSN